MRVLVVEDTPELARQLDARGVNYILEFLGDGDGRPGLQKQLPDRSRFRFAGRRPRAEVWETLSRWDAMIFTSDYEGTPLAMLEGMAAGVLPIHPALGSGGDAVASALNPKLVYPAADMGAMADSLQWLAGVDAGSIIAMQRRALEMIEPQRAENARAAVARFFHYIAKAPPLERRPGDKADDPRDHRRQMVPQPCFQQEKQGQQNPEGTEPAAHPQ